MNTYIYTYMNESCHTATAVMPTAADCKLPFKRRGDFVCGGGGLRPFNVLSGVVEGGDVQVRNIMAVMTLYAHLCV